MKNIAVIGTGAYGIALASIFDENKCFVTMWTKFENEKEEILTKRSNERVLPGFRISDTINITTDIKECVKDADLVVIAVPAGVVDDVSKLLKGVIKDQVVCIASKGIEQDTCLFVNDVFLKHVKTEKLAIISGPSFAVDIISKMPIGLTLATTNKEAEKLIKETLQNNHLKLRTTTDIYGTEICGSIKNVIAIASGMLDGLGANESTKAMFITESLHDIKELIKNLGGDGKTILSFAGFGDLLLTCTSTKSRNFSFGKILATGTKDEVEEYKKTHTIEGLYTLQSIYTLLNNKKVDMPIIDLIYSIIFDDVKTKELLTFLIEKN